MRKLQKDVATIMIFSFFHSYVWISTQSKEGIFGDRMFVEDFSAESKLEGRFLKPEIFSFLAARRLMKPGALVCPSQTDGKYFTKQSKGKQRKQTNKQPALTKGILV